MKQVLCQRGMAASSLTPTSLSDADDLYLALINENERFPISDDTYALELQLQEAIMASISQLPLLHRPLNPMVSTNYDATYVAADPGGPFGSFCKICIEGKPLEDKFYNNNCSHVLCSDCISKYIAFKIQEKIETVMCPSPEYIGVLEPEICRPIVPEQMANFKRTTRGFPLVVRQEDSAPLREYINKFGELEDVIVMKDRSTGRSRGFGYVTFSSADDAKVYMTYAQALYGGGGWPLSVFLSPNLKPLMGGTYFPPDDKYRRPRFKTVLRPASFCLDAKF